MTWLQRLLASFALTLLVASQLAAVALADDRDRTVLALVFAALDAAIAFVATKIMKTPEAPQS